MRIGLFALVPLAVVAGCSSGGRHAQDACGSKQLGVFAVTQDGGGATIGSFRLRNNGSGDCWLSGRAGLSILDGGGRPLAMRVVPPKRSTMQLSPHGAAEVRFQWHNWCKLTAPAALKLVLPQGGGTIQTNADICRPRCDEPKAPSTLVVSTFVAAT
jgi:Protein of unknown function (DUF4232)